MLSKQDELKKYINFTFRQIKNEKALSVDKNELNSYFNKALMLLENFTIYLVDLVGDDNSSKILEVTKDRLSKLGLKNNTVNETKNDDAEIKKEESKQDNSQPNEVQTKQEPSNDSSLTNEEYNDKNKNNQGETNDNSGKSRQDERSRDSKNEHKGLRETIKAVFGRDVSEILRSSPEEIPDGFRGICKRWMEAKCSGLRYDARLLGNRKFYANIDGKTFRAVFKEVYTFLGDNLNVDILEESDYKNNINYLSEDGLSGLNI